MRTLIRGGLVVDPAQNLEAQRDVLLENGRVEALLAPGASKRVEATRVVDARGLWVLPGLVDMHVHLREPGRAEAETFATGGRAAAKGGVTTVLAMPNTEPPIDSPDLVRLALEWARASSVVNVLVAGAVTRGQKGEALAELGRMAAAGAAAFTDDGRPVMNAQLMRRALEYAKSLGLPVLDHCEDENLARGGAMHEGPASSRKGLPGVPAEAETVLAARDIALAELTGGRLHICHASCAGTVELVRRAKKRGARVTAETAPHYFTLCDEDIPGWDADFKMNPPLRGRADLEAVRAGLADGTLDAVATDHAPHAPAAKAAGFLDAPCGVIGLETLLPLTLALIERKILSRKAAVARLSVGPARILGLGRKGGLKPGMDADLAVVDPKAAWTAAAPFESKSRNTPFKGRKLRGRALWTFVGGRAVLENGVLAQDGPRPAASRAA